jgi:hypothetical protein
MRCGVVSPEGEGRNDNSKEWLAFDQRIEVLFWAFDSQLRLLRVMVYIRHAGELTKADGT